MPCDFEKDSDAVMDYQIDWTLWLNGDVISTSTWIVPTGITKDSDTNSTKTATIWLSGGTIGDVHTIVNRIVTPTRTEDRTITVTIVSK